MAMQQGDYILSAELIRKENGYSVLLEVEDKCTGEVSFTSLHGNLTMADLDVVAIRNSQLTIFTHSREDNILHAVFDNGYQAISWRCTNPKFFD